MSRYKRDNSGGYGNPPVSGQFPKNNPGGPGRPKGSNSIDSALRKVFSGKVPYSVNGQPVTGFATEALSMRALQLGMSGSPRANAAALELAAKYGPREEEPVEKAELDYSLLSDEELEVLGGLLAKMSGLPYETLAPRRKEPRLLGNSDRNE